MSNMKFKIKKYSENKKEVIAAVSVAITLFLIILFSMSGNKALSKVTSGTMDAVSPSEAITGGLFSSIKRNISGILSYKENMKHIEDLSKENQKLKKELIDMDILEEDLRSLEDLKNALNYVGVTNPKSYVSASVVAKNDGNWYESFVISAGEKDGVEIESIVVTGDGLAGIVYEVSSNYSKAISLLNYKSAVSFKVLRKSDYMGVIRKNISVDSARNVKGYLMGYMFDMEYDVVPGDILITSGLGMYPEGIPIGEIEQVMEDKKNLVKNIKVRPYVNFKKLDDVMVITPNRIE